MRHDDRFSSDSAVGAGDLRRCHRPDKNLKQAVIIYMAYSVIMSVIWILLESPDLAITEAAVGAGITGILFFLTLHRLHLIDADDAGGKEKEGEEDAHEEDR